MSNNNDNGAAMGLGLVVALFVFAAIFFYALAVFIATAFTILAIFAWHLPVTAFGKTLCTPLEARIFIGSGIAGAVGVCAFAGLCTILFDTHIDDEWWFYLMTGGYSFVSLMVMMNLAEQHPNGLPNGLPNDPHHYAPVVEHDPVPPSLPRPAPAPFEYASWNDDVPPQTEGQPQPCSGCTNLAPLNPNAPRVIL